MSIGHPIPEIWLFQNLTLKIQDQGHGWGNIESHKVGVNSLTHTLSFHVNRPIHSWDTAFSKFDLENPRSRSNGYDVAQLQVHRTSNGINPSSGFRDMGFRKVWPNCCLIWQVFGPWASPYGANGQITMTLHNYRSRQVHETLNGVNPSSSFRDMRSAKSGPNLWQIWQVFGPWASLYGANGQIIITVHNYRPRQFHRTLNGENPSNCYRDMGSTSLAAARPPGLWRQYPSSLKGWGVKRCDGWTDRRTDWTSHIAAWSQLKTIGHLFYATSSFVHHFVAIGEFKLQLQSGNTQFGSNSTIFIEPCDLEIWGMTLKNNTPPLLCYFKLCASFLSHWWNLTDDLQKQ